MVSSRRVDYRRGTLVMRDDVSGSFVTVAMRGNDPRFGNLRPGDAIDLTGAWNRAVYSMPTTSPEFVAAATILVAAATILVAQLRSSR
jgi:hypothetical protein